MKHPLLTSSKAALGCMLVACALISSDNLGKISIWDSSCAL